MICIFTLRDNPNIPSTSCLLSQMKLFASFTNLGLMHIYLTYLLIWILAQFSMWRTCFFIDALLSILFHHMYLYRSNYNFKDSQAFTISIAIHEANKGYARWWSYWIFSWWISPVPCQMARSTSLSCDLYYMWKVSRAWS